MKRILCPLCLCLSTSLLASASDKNAPQAMSSAPSSASTIAIIQQLQTQLSELRQQQAAQQASLQAMQQQIKTNTPPGTIMTFADASIPEGWLACDGQEVLIHEYQYLYDTIGKTFDPNPREGHFRLPDLRGEFIRGWSNGRETVDSERPFGSWQGATHVQVDVNGDGTVQGAIDADQNDLIAHGYEPSTLDQTNIHYT